jgi:hypothetical protein|tara:strand:- start:1616 stop:2230 length:615 start_codon:yes stop_codon:yes gene_type:complete
MTSTNAITRQPTQLDYASPTQFKFNITKLPKVEYFCTEVNIPSLQMTNATQVTPLRDIPLPGTKLDFGDLVLTFMIDEKLENYEEVFAWLRGLGFPEDHSDYSNLVKSGRDRFPTQGKGVQNANAGREGTATPQGGILSDATLTILSAKNNPIKEVRFRDIFPVSLTGVNYSQQAGDVQYLTSSVSFKYTTYSFAEPGKTSTTY